MMHSIQASKAQAKIRLRHNNDLVDNLCILVGLILHRLSCIDLLSIRLLVRYFIGKRIHLRNHYILVNQLDCVFQLGIQ